jgi:hypothetical protein
MYYIYEIETGLVVCDGLNTETEAIEAFKSLGLDCKKYNWR